MARITVEDSSWTSRGSVVRLRSEASAISIRTKSTDAPCSRRLDKCGAISCLVRIAAICARWNRFGTTPCSLRSDPCHREETLPRVEPVRLDPRVRPSRRAVSRLNLGAAGRRKPGRRRSDGGSASAIPEGRLLPAGLPSGVSAFLRVAFFRPAFLRVAFLRVAFLRPAFLRPAFLRPAFLRPAFLRPAFLRPAFLRPSCFGLLAAFRPSCVRPSCEWPSCVRPSCEWPSCVRPSCVQPSCVRPSCAWPSCESPSCDRPFSAQPSCELP